MEKQVYERLGSVYVNFEDGIGWVVYFPDNEEGLPFSELNKIRKTEPALVPLYEEARKTIRYIIESSLGNYRNGRI